MRLAIIHQPDRENYNGLDADDIAALKEQVREELRDPGMGVVVLPPGVEMDIIRVDEFTVDDLDGDEDDEPQPTQPAPPAGGGHA